MNVARALPVRESALADRWAAGLAGPLRMEDGRLLRVVFPGVPGGGAGPDFRGAILEAGGDLLRGDVELHLLASGWRTHGHERDPAFAGVVLHVVGANDGAAPLTGHASGRLIPILVLPPEAPAFPPPFTPPCALAAANGRDPRPALQRMGLRRMRMKSARVAPALAAHGPGQALYGLLLETLGGTANREPFAALARRMPLAALLELAERSSAPRPLALAAHLKGEAAALVLRRAGLRPMAAPGRRLELAARMFARLWPAGAGAGWPEGLAEPATTKALEVPGAGRSLAIECFVNAVLPVACAGHLWPEPAAEAAYLALKAPGTYGKLKPLERWLGTEANKPFADAALLQGGLLLHAEYCTQGRCGRCPLSE